MLGLKSYWIYVDFMIFWTMNWKAVGLLSLVLILLYIGLGLIKFINQAGMSLEKYEDFLKVSVKQLLIQSSPISLVHIM